MLWRLTACMCTVNLDLSLTAEITENAEIKPTGGESRGIRH